MPMAVSPSPMTAPAVMIAPHSARMDGPPAQGAKPRIPRRTSGHCGRDVAVPLPAAHHLEAATENQQDARQNDDQAATAAGRVGPVGPAWPHAAPAEEPAAAQQ